MRVLISYLFISVVRANVPLFDVSTAIRVLLIPHDAKVGSAIYRLRGTDADFDYPLHFEVLGVPGTSIISVENYPCTRNQTFCEGNIILRRHLERNRVYDVKLKVSDTSGEYTILDCTIRASNGTTPTDTIFPHLPVFILVPEDAAPGTELGYIIARKHPLNTRHASLEIRGAKEFTIRQALSSSDTVNGTVILDGALDFEKKSLYILNVYAVDPYAEVELDTRNVASFQLAINVQDVQDMPPDFVNVPPVTFITHTTKEGDVVLSVHAEDGDKGNPRDIRYGIVSEGNPFTTFFHMNQTTGNITLIRPFRDLVSITRPNQPVVLSIIAEEFRTELNEPPAMMTEVKVAFLLGDMGNTPPYFEQDEYTAHIPENSPQGTAIIFGDPYIPEVRDDDMGKSGVFSLSLENDNGTFEVSPTVGERRAVFVIHVRNNKLLDYEARKIMKFQIVAKEVGPGGSQSSTANITVHIEDVNDNPPVFIEPKYEVDLPENVTAGVRVVQVKAEDADAGINGKILYTQILGAYNTSLLLDAVTGIITVSTNKHDFDREQAKSYSFNVVARDEEGNGNRATVPLIIRMIDVNDETPQFDKQVYEFYLSPNQRNFTAPAFLRAVDGDAEAPNNWVKYEIISGNYDNKFYLDEDTGELYVRNPPLPARRVPRWDKESDVELRTESVTLTVRAYDLGVPHRWSTASIHILPSDANTRSMVFIVNGSNPDKQHIVTLLNEITGARVRISEIKPYYGGLELNEYSGRENSPEKSVVIATVSYDGIPVVDLSKLQNRLLENVTTVEKTKVVEASYRVDSSPLFWLMMILAVLLILLVLFLLLCCFCPGCPLYLTSKKMNKVNSMEDVHLIIKEKGPGKESKSVQVERSGLHREAWSADQRHHQQQQIYFNRRNNPPHDYIHILNDRHHGQDISAAAAAATNVGFSGENHSFHSLPAEHHQFREGPTVIYTRELQGLQRQYNQNREIYVEDIEGVEYPITGQLLDLRQVRISNHDRSDHNHHNVDVSDTDSIRQHEVDRGSDIGMERKYYRTDTRRERDRRSHDKQYRIVLQRASHSRNDEEDNDIDVLDENELNQVVSSRREQFYIRDGDAEILRLVTRGRSMEGQHTVTTQIANEESNDHQRPMTLVESNKHEEEEMVENGKDIIMQRFMEDQRNNTAQDKAEESQVMNGGAALESLQQHDILIKKLIEEEEARLNNMRLLSEALARRHEKEADFLLATTEQHETQSLPGQVTMATQTDVDNSTQTEPLCLVRPPRRRARSENDDSYTEDYESDNVYGALDTNIYPGKHRGYIRKGFNKGRKRQILRHKQNYKFKRYGISPMLTENKSQKRHKIKTPILEETESALEALDNYTPNKTEPKSNSYSENKSSMLRKRNNKIKTISTSSGNMIVIPVNVKEDIHDVEEDTPSDSLEESTNQKRIPSKYTIQLFVNNEDSDEESQSSLNSNGKVNDTKKIQAGNTLYERKEKPKKHKDEDRNVTSLVHSSKLGLHSPIKGKTEIKHAKRRFSLSEPRIDRNKLNGGMQDASVKAQSLTQINENNLQGMNVSTHQPSRTSSRYMEWYKTKKEERERQKKAEMEYKKLEEQRKWEKLSNKARKSAPFVKENKIKEPKIKQKNIQELAHLVSPTKDISIEGNALKVLFEDDLDSGIAMSSLLLGQTMNLENINKSGISNNKKKRSQELMEKKSVFTIAYDDMQTKQIRSESTTPQYNIDI